MKKRRLLLIKHECVILEEKNETHEYDTFSDIKILTERCIYDLSLPIAYVQTNTSTVVYFCTFNFLFQIFHNRAKPSVEIDAPKFIIWMKQFKKKTRCSK